MGQLLHGNLLEIAGKVLQDLTERFMIAFASGLRLDVVRAIRWVCHAKTKPSFD
jgi:hypothetical protein